MPNVLDGASSRKRGLGTCKLPTSNVDIKTNRVGCATTNEFYNEQFLSIKSGCYNERGGILFVIENSIIVFTRERMFMLLMCVRLFMLFIRGTSIHSFH